MLQLFSNLLPGSASAAACLAALVAVWGAILVRGSTAVPAAFWSVVACLALAAEMGARAAGGLGDPATAAAARLAVVSLSFCPALSLLGAKRPQHGVWQLIVATLAIVLAMPAASARLMRPDSLPDVHLLERCFMPLLVLVGWMNFAGTRRAAAVTCVAAAQLLLMRGFLPGATIHGAAAVATAAAIDAAAAGLLLAGAVVAAAQALLSQGGPAGSSHPATSADAHMTAVIDRPFLALRETLGAAWTLRIAERFDTVAASHGWPCRLRFGGLDTGGDPPDVSPGISRTTTCDTSWHRDALRAFRALMRRFVSEAWLARHGCASSADQQDTRDVQDVEPQS